MDPTIGSATELVARAEASEPVAALLQRGDWYLVGSRATGMGDDLSDWDTVLLTDSAVEDLPREALDAAFAVDRPTVAGAPDLALHVHWRQAAGVDLEVIGPAGRASREREAPAVWAYELRHAVPLRLVAGVGEPYRGRVASRFADLCPELARQAYRAFRTSRNEAVACLPRADGAAQALTAAACVSWAARYWLLAGGEPYPSDKWLLRVLERDPGPARLLAAMRAAVDLREEPSARFDALWRLWELVDSRRPAIGQG